MASSNKSSALDVGSSSSFLETQESRFNEHVESDSIDHLGLHIELSISSQLTGESIVLLVSYAGITSTATAGVSIE